LALEAPAGAGQVESAERPADIVGFARPPPSRGWASGHRAALIFVLFTVLAGFGLLLVRRRTR
jgi:hypothetical protein